MHALFFSFSILSKRICQLTEKLWFNTDDSQLIVVSSVSIDCSGIPVDPFVCICCIYYILLLSYKTTFSSIPLNRRIDVSQKIIEFIFADGFSPHLKEGLLGVHVANEGLQQRRLALVLNGIQRCKVMESRLK